MKAVKLIDNVCWGKIARLQWSKKTNILYCICGDIDQTLKAYNPKDFTSKKPVQPFMEANTTKESIYGFVINDNPQGYFDEFIIFGKRQFRHCGVVKNSNKYNVKTKQVQVTSFKKDGEKCM